MIIHNKLCLRRSKSCLTIFGAVKIAFRIVYYFNRTDNPKTQFKLHTRKCLVQSV